MVAGKKANPHIVAKELKRVQPYSELIDTRVLEEIVSSMAVGAPRKDFVDKFKPLATVRYVLDVILIAKCSENMNIYRAALYSLAPLLDAYDRLLLYRMSLLDDWHREHEEIITGIQVHFSTHVSNIVYIEHALTNIPDYLQGHDQKTSYIRNCIFALALHPRPESTTALQRLSLSSDNSISSVAQRQLNSAAWQ